MTKRTLPTTLGMVLNQKRKPIRPTPDPEPSVCIDTDKTIDTLKDHISSIYKYYENMNKVPNALFERFLQSNGITSGIDDIIILVNKNDREKFKSVFTSSTKTIYQLNKMFLSSGIKVCFMDDLTLKFNIAIYRSILIELAISNVISLYVLARDKEAVKEHLSSME